MEVLFVLRSNKRDKTRMSTLYCRITYNGKRASEFSTFVNVWPQQWHSKTQVVIGKGPEVAADNDTLQNIRTTLKEIYNEWTRKGKPITAQALKLEYTRMNQPVITFLKAFTELLERKRVLKMAHNTLRQNMAKYNNTKKFLDAISRPDLLPEEFDERLADNFRIWLLTNLAKCGNDHAMKHLQLIKQVLKHCVRQKYLVANPLQYFELRFDKPKDPIALTDEELALLENYRFASPALQKAADYFVFNCYTGFAYVDYMNFHPDEHLKKFGDEDWIIHDRQKSGETAILPFREKARRILQKYNGNLPKMEIQTYNRFLGEIAQILGIPKRLTTHAARKTASQLWQDAGVPDETIARMLGQTTTQNLRRYARISMKRIAEDTKVLK
jgi:integrase/recombinase XerD